MPPGRKYEVLGEVEKMNDPEGVCLMETFIAKPDCVESLKALLQEAAARTRQEPGCRQLKAFQDQHNPTKFVVFAIFADQQAVEQHRAAEWHREIRARLPELLAGERVSAMGLAIA